MNPYITSKAGKRWSAGEKYSFPENVTGRTFESFILKDILLQPPSNLLAPLKRVYLKKGDVIFVSTSPDPGINKVQVCSGRGRHKSAVLSLYGWVIAPIFLPYNNDLHDRPVTVDEVTGRGFKATVHMVKDNKYSHDKMRVEMTDGTRYFFFPLSSSMPCVSSIKSLLLWKEWPEKVKEVQLWLREERRKKKLSSFLSQGSFITINCVMTPADIQIDLPSSGDHLACAEVSHTKDSFVSLMKGFLP